MKNYYAILEVPVGCPVPEIRDAYRRLVQENLWNKETFAELKEAYEVLTTPSKRDEYDKANFGEVFSGYERTMQSPAPGSAGRTGTGRHCPMGAAGACPALNARVPLNDTYCPECGFLLAEMSSQEFEPVSAPDPSRQIRLEDDRSRVFPLRTGANTVGREAADILLPDKTVSRRHAQIEVSEDGTITVEDFGSTNGTRVNGVNVSAGSAQPILNRDALQFGSIDLRLRLPEALVPADEPTQESMDLSPDSAVTEGTQTGARLIAARKTSDMSEVGLVQGVTTFGRRADNTIVLREDPYVSGMHAQIIAEEDDFRLTDLNSTNGTFVNREPLAPNQPRVLVNGDEVAFGGTVFRFEQRNGVSRQAESTHDSPMLAEPTPEPDADDGDALREGEQASEPDTV